MNKSNLIKSKQSRCTNSFGSFKHKIPHGSTSFKAIPTWVYYKMSETDVLTNDALDVLRAINLQNADNKVLAVNRD